MFWNYQYFQTSNMVFDFLVLQSYLALDNNWRYQRLAYTEHWNLELEPYSQLNSLRQFFKFMIMYKKKHVAYIRTALQMYISIPFFI